MGDSGDVQYEDSEGEYAETAAGKEDNGSGDNNEIGSCVFLSTEAFRYIDDYSRSDTSSELTGFLFGNYAGEKGNYRVWVEAAVAAVYTETDETAVRFSHRTWEHLKEEAEKNYPSYRIIGWFHSRPGHGTIIPDEDIFIQEMFFDSFWQLTYIIDPLSREHAFYGWDRYDEISPVSFKLEGEPMYVAISGEERKMRKKKRKKRKKDDNILWDLGKMGAGFIAGLLLFYVFNSFYYMPLLKERVEELEASVETKEEMIESLRAEIDLVMADPEDISQPDETLETDERQETDGTEGSWEPEEQEQPDPPAPVDETSLRTHTVAEGETLWSISAQYLGDGGRFNELAELNDLGESRNLEPGMVLKIPDN